MSEEMLVRHCAPTLAGLKTGNLFSCEFEDEEAMRFSLRRWNRILGKKGLRLLPLRFRENRGLIYVFRPSRLSLDLQDHTAGKLLQERGYAAHNLSLCVLHLIRRIAESEEFPHEIGLFLSYPPEDVCGFIENGGEGCKCTGFWKVYGDEEKCRSLFAKYQKCTAAYLLQLSRGRSVERLAVGQAAVNFARKKGRQ